MIKNYIKELHTRSESHRKKVAYGTSAAITLVIALVWVTSFGYFNKLNQAGDNIADNTSTPTVVAKSDTNKNYLSNMYQALRSAVGAKTTTENQATSTGSLEYVPDQN